LEYNLMSLELEKKTATTGLLLPEFRINSYSSYFGGLEGEVSPVFPADYPDPQQLYPTSEANLSLMWKVPLSSLTYKGDIKQYNSEILIHQNQMEKLKASVSEEIDAAQHELRTAREQLDIALEGSQFAEEALSQSIQRQQLGTVRPFEILQAQEIFVKARLDYIHSVTSYNKSQYNLFVAKGGNL